MLNEIEIKAAASAIVNYYKGNLQALDEFFITFADSDAAWTTNPSVKHVVREAAILSNELYPPRAPLSDDEVIALLPGPKYQ